MSTISKSIHSEDVLFEIHMGKANINTSYFPQHVYH